ncbi:MAG: sulfotransferase family protein [Candidatus Pelagadaptatus aseana]|uniref:sulfotransferase n=1 Tax=Candidatus Pelagadaptatus aseana TaxID=3120508 RepID=UPI0039B15EDF
MQQCVLVVGPGRSGTSTVSGVLSRLGVDFGSDLIAADYSNPKGYFESASFLRLNKKLYAICHDAKKVDAPSLEEVLKLKDKHSIKCEECINSIKKNSLLWGLKAWRVPMNEFFMDFIGDFKVVRVSRNVDCTAKSLVKHVNKRKGVEKINFEEAKNITKGYSKEIELFVSRYKPDLIDLSYEDLINRTEFTVRELASFLDIPCTEQRLTLAADFVIDKEEIESRRSEFNAERKNIFRQLKAKLF